MVHAPATEWMLSVSFQGKTHVVHLGDKPVCIGRSSSADVRLLSSRVSRRHAELKVDADGNPTVTDLHSHNGTLVNSDTLDGTRRLKRGDRIRIAHWKFVVEERRRKPNDGPDTPNAPMVLGNAAEMDIPQGSASVDGDSRGVDSRILDSRVLDAHGKDSGSGDIVSLGNDFGGGAGEGSCFLEIFPEGMEDENLSAPLAVKPKTMPEPAPKTSPGVTSDAPSHAAPEEAGDAIPEAVAATEVDEEPEVVTDAMFEAAPESTTETLSEEVASEVAPEVVATETAFETAPEAATETVPQAEPEAVAETLPEKLPEVAPEAVVAEAVLEAKPEAAPETVSEAAPEAVAETVTETVLEAKPEVVSEAVSEAEPAIQAAAEPIAKAAPEPAIQSIPEPTPEAVQEPLSSLDHASPEQALVAQPALVLPDEPPAEPTPPPPAAPLKVFRAPMHPLADLISLDSAVDMPAFSSREAVAQGSVEAPVLATPAMRPSGSPKTIQPSPATLAAAQKLMDAARRNKGAAPAPAPAPAPAVQPAAPAPVRAPTTLAAPAATAPQALDMPAADKPRQTIKVVPPAPATMAAARKLMEAAQRNKAAQTPPPVISLDEPEAVEPGHAPHGSRPKARDISPANAPETPKISAAGLGAVQAFAQRQMAVAEADERRQRLCSFAVGGLFPPNVAAIIRIDAGQAPAIVEQATSLLDGTLHLDANLISAAVQGQTAMVAWDTCLGSGAPAVAVCCPLSDGECLYAATVLSNANGAWISLLAEGAFMDRMIRQLRGA